MTHNNTYTLPKKASTTQIVVNEAVRIGRIWAWVKFGCIMLLGVIILSLGISLHQNAKSYKFAGKVKARVISSQCVAIAATHDPLVFDCNVRLQYVVKNVTYERLYTFEGVQKQIVDGDIVRINYNPSNPNEISEDNSQVSSAWILIAIGILLLVIGPIYLWVVLNYKLASLLVGGGLVASVVV